MEFDADMVVFIEEYEGWEPGDYIRNLAKIFRENSNYKNITRLKTRCVTIDYSGDFHLDVVPIVVKPSLLGFGSDNYYVCNRVNDVLEKTDGDGFKEWWRDQDRVTTNHRLIKTGRLIKYLRDTKRTFSCKSILLTTMIGKMVYDYESVFSSIFEADDDPYSDVPTTLKTIFQRLDNFLQDNEHIPDIENPALDGESFTRNWTDDQYKNFRDKVADYREWIEDAYSEENRSESIRKWRKIFGEKFARDMVLAEAAPVTQKSFTLFDYPDPINALKSMGKRLLSLVPATLPHVVRPKEKVEIKFNLNIKAYEKSSRGSARQRLVESGDIVKRGSGLEFVAVNNMGAPIDSAYNIKWRVVNTGEEAKIANCLRGGFEASDTHGSRFESTAYRGVHWVEAMAVNKRTGTIQGMSERFYVAVE